MRMLSLALDLNDAQQEQIKAIFEGHRQEFDELESCWRSRCPVPSKPMRCKSSRRSDFLSADMCAVRGRRCGRK